MDSKVSMPPDSNRRGRMSDGFAAVAIICAAALLSFVLAMHCFPGGYNPLMRMLSALGRTEVRLVEWPWSHYLFMAGMFFSALAVVSAACRTGLSKWGAALNVAVGGRAERRGAFVDCFRAGER